MELAGERREAQLRGRQGRLAFAYLVLHRDRPVRRDELIEALWAHEGAPPSDTALAPVLSRLRRAIEPAVLEGRDTLRLVFPEPVWIDVEAIRDLVASARPRTPRARPPSSPSPTCCPQLDAPWLTGPRDDLEELRIEALETIAARRRRRTPSAPRRRGDRCSRRSASPLRAALIERADAARQHRRGAARLRRDPRAAARGARDDARAGAGRAARAAARARARRGAPRHAVRAARARRRAGRDRRRARPAARAARAACSRSRARRGSARRACSACCASARSSAGAEVLDARAGVLEREFGFGVVRQLFEAMAAATRRRRRALGVRRGRGRRRPVRGAQRALPVHGDARHAAPARALHRRPAVERHRPRCASSPTSRGASPGCPCSSRPRSAPASPTPTSCCWARSGRTRRPSPCSRGR